MYVQRKGTNRGEIGISVNNGGTPSETARFLEGGGITFNGDSAQQCFDDYDKVRLIQCLTELHQFRQHLQVNTRK